LHRRVIGLEREPVRVKPCLTREKAVRAVGEVSDAIVEGVSHDQGCYLLGADTFQGAIRLALKEVRLGVGHENNIGPAGALTALQHEDYCSTKVVIK